MNSPVITVDNLAKCYRIGTKENHENMISAVADFIKSPWKNYRRYRSLYKFDELEASLDAENDTEYEDILWALKNVSFEVKKGEVLGIIGKNGAGKSTLLKILSRITEPTFGKAVIKGRVSSLLEVGTGFHPELTGRENIYVNGTILGMSKREIDIKYDDIVEFSGVERFIDTPVKRYSSGMQVRLAFAVAAHLDPEILIVDEVLAVGDVSFQKKCIGKMSDVAKSGRTVLFVSHNMGAVKNLCQTGIWIDQGTVTMRGDIESVVRAYMKTDIVKDDHPDPDSWDHKGSGELKFCNAALFDADGNKSHKFGMGETIVCELDIAVNTSYKNIDKIALGIRRADTGVNILHVMSQDSGLVWDEASEGVRRLRVEIPECMLYPGHYRIALFIGSGIKQLDFIRDTMGFEIMEKRVSKRDSSFAFYAQSALVHVRSNWEEIESIKN